MTDNVLINARFLTQPITGVQRFAIELSKALKAIDISIRFIAPRNVIHREVASLLEVETIGTYTGHLWEQIELPLLLKQRRNHLLVNLCNTAPVILKNNIVVVHDISFMHHPEWYSKKFATTYQLFIPYIIKKSKQVLTVSNYSRQDISYTLDIPKSSIEVLYQQVAPIFFDISNVRRPNKYGRYILGVSSIDPRKNFIGLVKAFRASGLTDTKLVIVGQQHKVFADSQLKSLIEGDESIIFTGYVDDVELVNLYHHAMLFAYPSYFEGFGIPPLEAMACGCPTLVSNTTSMPEVCGDASLYVDPYDIDSIRKGLVEIATNLRLQVELREKGYKQVLKYSWRQSAENLVRIIDRLPKI
ncbi:glycosyltransferase family 4 protein [Spirosoma aerolatum]|uniref:glycosyltransferase family 4 protein n=1 Tax=Spirosoma aerolatum TaxID=1211326 RepID=UPI0009AE1017|nr:glycosyltransferase family 1 protein [Spirosoma aerolatum]